MKLHKTLHFVGIGGISMSALALIMVSKNCTVSGSDFQKSALLDKLSNKGIEIFIGHRTENVKNPDAVVYTAAISQDNPELSAARDKGIPCIERADFLGEMIKDYSCPIAISGTHGKTTATSMIACILLAAKKDPTVLVGGELNTIGGNLLIGGDEYMVFEACEYKDSFLKFSPKTALVLNIEPDHLDYFTGIDHIKESFASFLRLLPADSFAVINADDAEALDAGLMSGSRLVAYGSSNADYTAKNITYRQNGEPSFDIYHNDEQLGTVNLQAMGDHNVSNATGAFALTHQLGVDPGDIISGLESFEGTGRRFEFKAEVRGIKIYDDYAHHPTEITASLTAAKKMPHNRIWCIYQPHTYTRTKALFNEFVETLSLADRLIMADIYAAREPNDPLVHSKFIAEQVPNAVYIEGFDNIADYIAQNAETGDVVFAMGAGDIYKVIEKILKKL